MALASDNLRQLKEKIGRLGLLGGTFDPVHNGHLAAAEAVREGMGLDAILFIPAALPPHKTSHRISPFEDRVAMLELATAGRPELMVTSLEAQRQGPSYSVDTLRQLHQLWNDQVRLFFIIGLDAFIDIASWKEYQLLPRLADLVVLNRPSHGTEQMAETIRRFFPDFSYHPREKAWIGEEGPARIHFFAMEPLAVSSTLVRKAAAENDRLEQLVPPAVAQFIRIHDLYGGLGAGGE